MIQLSVKTLLDLTCFSGDLNLESSNPVRAQQGIRAHQKLQALREKTVPDYKKEVFLSYQFEVSGFSYNITGRLDSLFQAAEPDRKNPAVSDMQVSDMPVGDMQVGDMQVGDIPVIEEIKSLVSVNEFEKNRESLKAGLAKHWHQLMGYGALYFLNYPAVSDEIILQLTYVFIKDNPAHEIKRSFKKQELLDFLSGLLEKHAAYLKRKQGHIIKRKEQLVNLDFPFEKFRPGQRKVSINVYSAVRLARNLIFSAPTGTGKTMAALFPGLKAMGESRTDRIFYATARTSNIEMAEQALEYVRIKAPCLKSISLTSKERICPYKDLSCTPDECTRAKGHFDRLEPALEEAFNLTALNRINLLKIAEKHSVCPFEFSLDVSLFCDVIICDYNYIFDPRVYLRRFFDDDSSKNSTLLVDEAHNLVSRGRDMYSCDLSMNTLKSLMTKLKSIKLFFKSKGSSKSIYKAFSSIIEEIEKIMKIDFPYVDIDVPQGLIKFIRNFAELCDLLDQKRIKAAYPEVSSFFLQVYFDMISFLRIYEYFGPAHRFIIEQGQEDIIVSLFCLNPSEFIKACSGRVKSSIFFSATLEPICFYAPLFGLDQDTVKLKCPSPFPKENFKVIIQTSCSMKYEHRDDALPDLALTMINMVKAKKGNYLLFLPSFLYLEKIRTILEKVLKGYSVDIVSQEKEMSIDLREEFLENFTETREKSLLGLAVMGGLFSEGIDLRGSRLSGAVIAGPGLPAVTFRRELIREYFENEFKQGFEFAYIYPGMNRVLQAAGRVIRSSKDRGAVILFDKRFSRNIYKKNLPSWWHKSESASPKVISRMLDRFWLAEPE